MIKTAVFPVAGLGSRFLPATKAIPKEMLIVVDKPLIQYAVEEAREAGIERFVFVTSQGKSAIEDHFDSSPAIEQILYARGGNNLATEIKKAQIPQGQAVFIRQPEPLGLGHALLCAQYFVDDAVFALILADDLIQANISCLKQMIEAYEPEDGNMAAVMDVSPENVDRYGILKIKKSTDQKVYAEGVIEKPKTHEAPSHTAIIGRYLLTQKIFDHLGHQKKGVGGEIQLTDAIASMLPKTPLCGFKFSGSRFDCGTKKGWLHANIAFARTDPDMKDLFTKEKIA